MMGKKRSAGTRAAASTAGRAMRRDGRTVLSARSPLAGIAKLRRPPDENKSVPMKLKSTGYTLYVL